MFSKFWATSKAYLVWLAIQIFLYLLSHDGGKIIKSILFSFSRKGLEKERRFGKRDGDPI